MARVGPVAAALLIAGAVLLASLVLPQAWDGAAIRAGAAFAFQSPERWFALLGAGLCLAWMPQRVLWAVGTAFGGGGALGLIAPRSALWPSITSAGVFPAHHVLGPAACLLIGFTLLARGGWRSGLLPPAVFVVAGALSLAAALNDPTLAGGAFVTGTLLSAGGIMAIAYALRRMLRGPWTTNGERIAGSWLLTVGLLLGALRLAPAPPAAVELAPPATGPAFSAPDVPGYAPPARHDADPFSVGFGRAAMPMGTN